MMSFRVDMPSEELKPGCIPSPVRYRVCLPNQYLVKTGWGVPEMVAGKNFLQWPGQRITVIDMNPRNYKFELQAMSVEMVPFKLPVVFTIGRPSDPKTDEASFMIYARRMVGYSEGQLTDVIIGVIHGQARLYSAHLTIKDMFADRNGFKTNVQERIQKDMSSYGLHIYNANIAEMKDLDENNKYFENLKQKALEGANTEMRLQVAEARKQGDIGESQRTGETKMQKAAIEANVAKNSNNQLGDIEKSQLDLALVKTQCKMQEQGAKIAADFNVKQKQVELQIAYEKATAAQQLEHLRAVELTKATVDAEKLAKKTEGEAVALAKKTEGEAFALTKMTEGQATALTKKTEGEAMAWAKKAEGEAMAIRTIADAQLYKETQEAEAIRLTRAAQAEGLTSIITACQQQPDLVTFYLAMEAGLYDRMAEQTAAAVQGLKPNINIWTTGPGGETGTDDGMVPLRKLFMSLPPMLDAVQQQMNIKMPGWMPQASAPI